MLKAVLRRRLGIHHSFDERVAGEAVAAVQSRAGTFAYGIEAAYARAGVEVYLDAAAQIMGARRNGDILFGNVDADRKAFGVDIREMPARLFRRLMRNVEAHVVDAVLLHLFIDGTRHNVARGQ